VEDAAGVSGSADAVRVTLGATAAPDQGAAEVPVPTPAASEPPAASASESPAVSAPPAVPSSEPSDPAASSPPSASSAPSASAPPLATPSAAPVASNPPAAPEPTDLTAQRDLRKGEFRVTYSIDPGWLAAPDRAFPVVLDPAVTIQANGTGTTSCNSTATNYADNWISSGLPIDTTCWSAMRIGYDNEAESPTAYSFGYMRALMWFKGVTLGNSDGAHITDATLSLYKYSGSARSIKTTLVTGSGWDNPDKWDNQQGEGGTDAIKYLCPDGTGSCTAATASYAAAVTSASTTGWFAQDISPLVRRWYTRNVNDWKPNFGLMTKFSTESTTQTQNKFRNGSTATVSERPKLVITYVEPVVKIGFDTNALGSDFVPSTMPANSTAVLPIVITNNSTFAFGAAADTDYYQMGYRWFDSKGKPVVQTGFTNFGVVSLGTDVAASGGTKAVALPVTSPPAAGQYTLRLDVVHVVDSVRVWLSDWAKPSKYNARKKYSASPANTRWTGTSNIDRAEFPMAVVTGQGTAIGHSESVDLADDSSVGINLWSKNLRYDGTTGLGFDDLADLGLTYSYDLVERTNCTGVLLACGWATNFDESFDAGTNGADYTYQDDSGNRYLVGINTTGQLGSAAPVRLDRVRHTVLDDNVLTWSGTAPVRTAAAPLAGDYVTRILATNTAGASSTNFRRVPVDHYAMAAFGIKGIGTDRGAIGFRIHNDSKGGTDKWLCYTVGGAFTVPGCTATVNNATAIGSWAEIAVNLKSDVIAKSIATTYEETAVVGIALYGKGGTGSVDFDAVRFTGRSSGFFTEGLPPFTANVANGPLETTDAAVGQNSIRVLPVAWASSPERSGLTSAISYLPYIDWHWKKVSGTTVALSISVEDLRDATKKGTVVYYAGALPTLPVALGADNCSTVAPITCAVRISDTIPTAWTKVTRNLLDDARQLFGFFNDVDSSGGTNVPNGGPTPDDVRVTAYRLVAQDGAYALFDDMVLNSIPMLGAGSTATLGPDFVVTRPGGETRTFNREGYLTSIADLDGNATYLDWVYPAAGGGPELKWVRAPGHGRALGGGGTAVRRFAVTKPTSTTVVFAEELTGVTGRRVEFTRNASNDLVSVAPARLIGACATSGPSGCTKFTYDAAHRLTRIDDPRNAPGGTMYATVTYNATFEPISINREASAPQLTVLAWNSASNTFVRPKWQDADGIAASAVRFADLSPNGSLLTEYAPQTCPAGNCSAVVPGDKLATYTTDGIDNYSTETRYRLPGNAGPVVTRRGTYAAAKVDNFSDPLTAGLTAWTQSAEQYAASVAAGNVDLYRTQIWYDAAGRPVRTTTPFANPADPANIPIQTVLTTYDATGHPTQVSDAAFLVNGGFEDALTGWQAAGASATPEAATIASGRGGLKLTGTGTATQEAQLLPGQTFRFQVALRSTAGSATVRIEARRQDGTWDTAAPIYTTSVASAPGFATESADVTIPATGSGRVRVILATTGTTYADDVVILTSYAASTHSGGLLQTQTDILGIVTRYDHAATPDHPAIFQTSVVQNDDASAPASGDTNVLSSRTLDAWGRERSETDPDGVTMFTTYAANLTDIATTFDELDNTTRFTSYDEIGQLRTEQNPVGRNKTTTYDWYGNPVDVVDFDGTVSHTTTDAVGRPIEQIENWLAGGATTGVDNVKTTSAYDAFGRVTTVVEDAGVSAATTVKTYDLLGNVTSETVYPDGTSNGRVTSTYYGAAGLPVGSSGPIVPTNAAAPACPGVTPAVKCNTVTSIDMNGRAANVTDAYNRVSLTWYDFAGKPVREVGNFVSGQPGTADQNVETVTRYDATDHVISVKDPLGQETKTEYDLLGRVVKVIRPDLSWVSTTYRPSGRMDLESKPTDTVGAEVWTKSVYDAAGRKTRTLDHYDTTGTARLWVTSFEGGTDDWIGTATGWFTSSSASVGIASIDASSGSQVLVATTGTGNYAGATIDLSGSTFRKDHTYRVRARVKAPTGTLIQAYFGVDASGGDYGTVPAVTASGGWQTLDGTWTPTVADKSANVHLTIRRQGSTSVAIRIDDVVVWDASSTLVNPSGPDWNIPSETVYDAAGRTIASVLPPGDPATDLPLVTLTSYDYAGQVAAVRVAATALYAVSVASEPSPVGHWRLDELTGTTAADQINGRTMTISGGVGLAAPSAIDDRPATAMTFDGTTGKLQVPFNETAWGLTGDTMTMEAWFKTSRTTGKGDIVRQSHYGLGFWLAQNGGVMEAVIYGTAQGYLSTTGYQDDAWHHMVATADGTTMRLYMDGILKGSTALSGSLNLWNDNLAIGALDSSSEWFTGSIDEVAIYGAPLSADQVATHFAIGRSADQNLLTTYAYDGVGNRIAARDPMGILSRLEYDRRGNVTGSTVNVVSGGPATASQNVKSTFAYNDRDEMTASCAPRQVQAGCVPATPSTSAWRYTFDALGHIVTETPPATGGVGLSATTYVYDADRGGTRLLQTCDHPAGGSCSDSTRHIDTAYDAMARVTDVVHYEGAYVGGTEKLKTLSTYDAAGQQTKIRYYEAGALKDTIDFAYDDLGRQTVVLRNTAPVTTATFFPDGSVKTRIDHAVSSTASTFLYNWRSQQVSATSPLYTGSTGFGWRLDGLLGSRTWPTGGNAATYAYDRAKRPVLLDETRNGSPQAAFTRSFNRAGDTVTEGRVLSQVNGIAGGGLQSFTYDALHRVIGTTVNGGANQVYSYDANSNRTSWNDGIATTDYTYNDADELVDQTRSGVTRTFTYDAYGNIKVSAVASAGATNYDYDAQDRLTAITPSSGGAITFTLDALGRHWTKRIGGTLIDTYGYAGASEAVVRIDQTGTSVSSAVDGLGNRVATATGSGGFGWLLADLHGDVAAGLNAGGTVLTDAFRYDPYGMTIGKVTSTLPTPWRYQGRLLLNTADVPGVNTDLYDFVARAYDPNLGAFTSLDTERGNAQNPLTLNRFLYALANPESLIDPDGHFPWDDFDLGKAVENVGNFTIGVGEGLISAGGSAITGTFELGKAAVSATVNAGGCAIDSSCRNKAIASASSAVQSFARDPGGTVRRAVDNAGNALGGVARGLDGAIRGAVDKVTTAWKTGDFRGLGRMTGEVGFNFIPVGAILGKVGILGKLTTAGSKVTAVTGRAGAAVTRAASSAQRFIGAARERLNGLVRRGASCANSFAVTTLVATALGAVAIGTLSVGDSVLAYDEATGTTGTYPISAVHINDDPVTGTVVISGETIETTPEHPFFTLEAGWLIGEDLKPGMHVPSHDGEAGIVETVEFARGRAIMYNLTVEVAHTFYVGEGEWLVHNAGPGCNVPGASAVSGPRWDPSVERFRDSAGRFARDPHAPPRISGPRVHGNSLASTRPATLYQRLGPGRTHQKFGISQHWPTRYSKKALGDHTLVPRRTGTRAAMRALEYRLNRRFPGPMVRRY
jgi:RHS repeat-associated protein